MFFYSRGVNNFMSSFWVAKANSLMRNGHFNGGDLIYQGDCQGQLQIKYSDSKRFRKMQKDEQTFFSLINDHDITPQEFFKSKTVVSETRNNLPRFVSYCKSHKAFTRRMINLAFAVSYQELEDLAIKTASHGVLDVLVSEESAIADLFFQGEPENTENNSEIPEQLEGSIQSEAQRLFFCDQEKASAQERPVELEKYEAVEMSLSIFEQPIKNQTCLGHLQKFYSFLIRNNPQPVLEYFEGNNKYLELLLSNLNYSSISSLVALLLTSEDKTKKYTYQGLKKRIIERVVKQMFDKIQDEDYFDGIMVLIQQILNTTKQSYYEYFEDFKRVSNILVSGEVMKRYADIILNPHQKSFRNASKFLEFLFSRINSEREDNAYYNRGQEAQASMNFQVSIFYENIPNFIKSITKINNFNNMSKISYLTFLSELLHASKSKKIVFNLEQPAFLQLLCCLNSQQKAGVYKGKLYNLTTSILSNANADQIKYFLEKHEDIYQNYFNSVKNANYSNTKNYNKNEASAFDVGLISQLSKRNDTVISAASKIIGKDFKRMCKKYETKIASFQSSNSFSMEEETSFQNFNFENNNNPNTTSEGGIPKFSLNFGKNNISIPILNLPDRNHTQQTQKRSESPSNSNINEVREVYQIEQVMNLTDNIKKIQINTDQKQIERPPELNRNNGSLEDSPLLKERDEKEKAQKIKLKEKKEDVDQIRFFAKHLAIFA